MINKWTVNVLEVWRIYFNGGFYFFLGMLEVDRELFCQLSTLMEAVHEMDSSP